MNEFIQEKNHMNVKLARNHFEIQETSKSMKEFIQLKSLLTAKLAAKPFQDHHISKAMRKFMPDKTTSMHNLQDNF